MSSALRVTRTYGPMDVDRWFNEGHAGKRVLCNGVDITDRCEFFDDRQGMAVCHVFGPEGHVIVDVDDLRKETIYGRIEVVK